MSTDVAVLLDEIRSCQDILSKITDMKLGYLGTALITITNQVCRSHQSYLFCFHSIQRCSLTLVKITVYVYWNCVICRLRNK